MRFLKIKHPGFILVLMGIVFFTIAEARAWNTPNCSGWAWSEIAGWTDFNPTRGGVVVHDTHLSGWAWNEGVGWIKLGHGAGPYRNDSKNNWGVNRNIVTGVLSGFAWSEIAGWIIFNSSTATVTVDSSTGRFHGYAWGENIGWIHFNSPEGLYGAQTDPLGVVTEHTHSIPALNALGMTVFALLLAILAVRLLKRGSERKMRSL